MASKFAVFATRTLMQCELVWLCVRSGEPDSEGLFTAMARVSDVNLSKIAVDVLGRAVRGQADAARLRQGGTRLRHRCADYLDAHRERFFQQYKLLRGGAN